MPRKVVQSIVHSPQSIVKDLSLCILSAGLLIFSFPNFNLWLFAWFGFVPLFFVLEDKPKWKAFFLSYLIGIIFWLGIIYWLVHVTLPGMIVLILYLALYFGIFGLLVSTIDYRLLTIDLVFIPSLWVLLEYLRSHIFTGFPWALLGYSQYLNLPAIQIADITGVWGVSFLVMTVNAAIYSVISSRFLVVSKKRSYIVPAVCMLAALAYGYFKIHLQPATSNLQHIKISVIQGNIPQEQKWDPGYKGFIINKYLALTRQAAKGNPDLIIWPEAALPSVLEEEPRFFETAKGFVKEIGMPLFLGSVTTKDNLYYNSALLISHEGQLLNKYDKLHLVPFGEYIPLRRTFRFLEAIVPIGDFASGREYTVFNLPATCYLLPAKFSVLICFEDLFPKLSREFVKKGADFLVNITNDAWFKETSSPYQHLQASVFRAVENRIFLVRAANTGVSGFIAPSGKITSLVKDDSGKNIFIDGLGSQKIPISKPPFTFYNRYGDFFAIACILFTLYGIISPLKK